MRSRDRLPAALPPERHRLPRAPAADLARQRTPQAAGGAAAEAIKQRERFLDDQAILPGSARRVARGRHGMRRAYPQLGALVDLTPEGYEALDPRRQREARLRIDRELAARRQARGLTREAEVMEQHASEPLPQPAVHRPQPDPREVSPLMRDLFEFMEGKKSELGWPSEQPTPLG